ncbi:MAG: GHKL domain-containing protein, partial [Ruminococcus sp.]|nr:GHKL domain-containing protein [Ruminococcus sp.]
IRTHLQVSSQQKELTAANNELTQFCSAVSHDLKAPFNIINMLIEMLRSELGDNPDESISAIMDMIVSKATQTKTMIERLFDFSKMCNVNAVVRRVDIKPIALDTYHDLRELEPPKRNIKFICGELPLIDCDEVLVRIILKNLLSNAIKYTSKRKKAVIELSGGTEQQYNIIKIKDNGSGFDMTYSKKLFQVFQRLHSDEEFEGSGVGLALINRIMVRHGGKIKAYGEVDKGGGEHIGDKAKQGPVNEVSHASRQHQGGRPHTQTALENFFHNSIAENQHHCGGDEGEQPGLRPQNRESSAGVLDVGQFHYVGDKGDTPNLRDIGADERFDELVEDHQGGGKDGIKQGISLSFLKYVLI